MVNIAKKYTLLLFALIGSLAGISLIRTISLVWVVIGGAFLMLLTINRMVLNWNESQEHHFGFSWWIILLISLGIVVGDYILSGFSETTRVTMFFVGLADLIYTMLGWHWG